MVFNGRNSLVCFIHLYPCVMKKLCYIYCDFMDICRFSLASWMVREGNVDSVVPVARLQQLYVLIEWLGESLFKCFHDFI